jgi:hypothetical protein
MGRHYVPQAYLRNFQVPDQPGFVWLYDKQGGEPHTASISKVAQSRDYYSPKTEEERARLVEAPANNAMGRLSRNEQLTTTERWNLAYYICTTLKRVPRRRRKAQEMYPEVLAATMAEVRTEFREMAQQVQTLDPAWEEHRLTELDAIEYRFSSEPPQGVVDQMRDPWPTKEMVDAVYRMAWRVLESSGPQDFITSDNPVFMFDGWGLTQERSEISFPLSATRALHGCWQGSPCSLVYMRSSQWLVRETNRRMASETERFAFCHKEEPWLVQVLSKENPFLSIVKW